MENNTNISHGQTDGALPAISKNAQFSATPESKLLMRLAS